MPTAPTSNHQHLTLRQLINLAAPMALSFVMMSGTAPIVTGGIAWKFGPEGESLHLSAFLVCFLSALLFYSAVLVSSEIAIRTVTDSASKRQYLRFFMAVSGACSVLLIVMSQVTPLNVFFYERLIGVDPLTRRDIHTRFLELLAAEPATVVLVTHDIAEARRLASELVIVHDGRLIQTGETAEVMRNPATKHVALLVGDSSDG